MFGSLVGGERRVNRKKGDGKIREKTQIVIVCYSEKGGEYWWVGLFFTWPTKNKPLQFEKEIQV